jgi:hypothetical protein
MLLSTQAPDGSFLCDVGTQREDNEDPAGWGMLLDKYHTTLVFLLLGAALREPGQDATPPSQSGVR